MKIAVSGKGGVGKTTIAAVLGLLFAQDGKKVIFVDADPDANLSSALGVPKHIIEQLPPICEMSDLIEERTGAKPGTSGGIFRLNPDVGDIPDSFGVKVEGKGVSLLRMGKPKKGGSGCYCPENVFLRKLLNYLIVKRDEIVIVDMEAGFEHMSRGTAEAVDALLVVVEPGQRSLNTAAEILKLAEDIGIKRTYIVPNKIRSHTDLEIIKGLLPNTVFTNGIKFDSAIVEGDLAGKAVDEISCRLFDDIMPIIKELDKQCVSEKT